MKKLCLEFIRGAAALTVVTYHFLELHTLSSHSKHFYFGNWGTDAVIIFFILSGIVINMSQNSNPKEAKAFMGNRILRIYPQLVAGLLLGLLVLYVTNSAIPPAGVIAGNFLMLSAVKDYMINIVPSLQSNSPIWSLSYEIVFYLLFALTIGKFQKRAIGWWFILSLAIMPLYYLQTGPAVVKHFVAVISFSSIWLTGYYIYQYRSYFYADKYTALFSVAVLPLISRMHLSTLYYDPAKYLLFAVFAVPFFSYCLQGERSGRKIRWYSLLLPYAVVEYIVFKQPYLTFTSFMAYSLLPVILVTACFIIQKFQVQQHIRRFIFNTGKVSGKYSYSIYVIHYPVLFFCASFFHNTAITLIVSFSGVALFAYCLENYLQPAIVNYFRKSKETYSLVTLKVAFKGLSFYDRKLGMVKKVVVPLATAISTLFLFPFNSN